MHAATALVSLSKTGKGSDKRLPLRRWPFQHVPVVCNAHPPIKLTFKMHHLPFEGMLANADFADQQPAGRILKHRKSLGRINRGASRVDIRFRNVPFSFHAAVWARRHSSERD